MTGQRKLAAILVIDIAGFSGFQADVEGSDRGTASVQGISPLPEGNNQLDGLSIRYLDFQAFT